VTEIHEIGEGELERVVAVRNAVWPHDPLTVDDYVDWRQQASDMAWFLAVEDGSDVGAGVGIHGWHSPPRVGRLGVYVLSPARARGAGSALLEELGMWLSRRGCDEATADVFEEDASSLAWAEQRGFTEVGRSSILALDVAAIDPPTVSPPAGLEIVSWAGRPELAPGLYDVYVEAAPDIPGEDEAAIPPFEEWLANDMSSASDRPEATFVALAGDEVVGYAKLSISAGQSDVAWHDITGVKRAWRGRGVAGALKRAEIAWAKENGFARLQTSNEERNEPIRRLNERHGYSTWPGSVSVRGPVPIERSRR
jgi:GNAT superfamily N-acetyltransferase